MGTGYTRNDVSNNIADGNIINASDLDGEFDAVESAFNSSTGHTHDGTAAEGGAITVVGPVQDLVVSATEVKPKTTNTLDLGTSGLLYKDAYLQGNMYFRDTALKIVSSADGQLDIDADVELELVAPTVDIDASTAVTIDTATLTVTGSANVVGDLDVDNININGNTISSTDTNGNITLAPNGTGVVALSSTDLTFGDNDKAIFGSGSDFTIEHNGSKTTLSETGTGNLEVRGTNIEFLDGTGVEYYLQMAHNGAVTLYHDNAAKLATTATGVDVTGTVTADGLTVENSSFPTLNINNASGTRLQLEYDTNNAIGKLRTTVTAPLVFETNNTERMRIDSSGNVGIGTSSPSRLLTVSYASGQADLSVQAASNNYAQVLFGYSGADNKGIISYYNADNSMQFYTNVTERMRIDSSGNVGIGTSSPTNGKLEVTNASSTVPTGFFRNTSTGGDSPSLTVQGGANNAAPNFSVLDYNGNTDFVVQGAGNVGIGTASPVYAITAYRPTSVASYVVGENGSGVKTAIGVAGDNGSLLGTLSNHDLRITSAGAEQMRIDTSGNVGIGTASPSSPAGFSKSVTLYDASDPSIVVNAGGSYRSEFAVSSGGGWVGTFDAIPLRLVTNNGERMRITSSGNVGIATTTPVANLEIKKTVSTTGNMTDTALHLTTDGTTGRKLNIGFGLGGGVANTNAAVIGFDVTSGSGATQGDLFFSTRSGTSDSVPTERMRIDSSGNVGIGVVPTTDHNPVVEALQIGSTANLYGRNDAETTTLTSNSYLSLAGYPKYITTNEASEYIQSSGNHVWYNAPSGTAGAACTQTERMRIDSNGVLLVGKTSATITTAGQTVYFGQINGTRDAAQVCTFNRLSDDGTLVDLRQDNVQEGTISVSGTTVSYNGGHLARWSQLADGIRDETIVKGTVLTNLDQMAVWHHEAVAATYYVEGDELPEITPAAYYTEDDTLPEGVSVGDEKIAAVYAQIGDEKTPAADAYTEDNEQLNCMAVSSVEGDPNVAGVFVNWDNDDDEFNDMNIAMTGDMVIRIAQGTTVARGDLLMSAGDGTAKPQGDDIVRSKTIAKVTSTHVSHTYDDGSYLVPCVLMAC